MSKKQIGLFFGSINSEHDISIDSAASVLEHFPHDVYDCIPVYIAKDGTFNTGNYTVEQMKEKAMTDHRQLRLDFDYDTPGFTEVEFGKKVNIDAAFLMLHGQMGEGGHVQGLLRSANIPFTGCDVLSSALCMDKAYTHQICEIQGIPMAQYQMIRSVQEIDESKLTYPCIVKPVREGSSFGVSIAKNKEEMLKACDFAFQYDSKILIEEFIDGVEVGMAILKTKDYHIVSEPDQVNVSGEIFDFQEKYHPHATETLPYALFDKDVIEKIKNYASLAFEALDCEQFSRIDFFVTKDNDIFMNEINTIPGFTINSRYPSMIARAGVPFTEMIRSMIEDKLS